QLAPHPPRQPQSGGRSIRRRLQDLRARLGALGRRARAGDALARAFGQGYEQVIIDHLDRNGPQPQAWVALMLAGGDVELVTVPGANDIALRPRKGQPQTGLVFPDALLDARDNLALADRP